VSAALFAAAACAPFFLLLFRLLLLQFGTHTDTLSVLASFRCSWSNWCKFNLDTSQKKRRMRVPPKGAKKSEKKRCPGWVWREMGVGDWVGATIWWH